MPSMNYLDYLLFIYYIHEFYFSRNHNSLFSFFTLRRVPLVLH